MEYAVTIWALLAIIGIVFVATGFICNKIYDLNIWFVEEIDKIGLSLLLICVVLAIIFSTLLLASLLLEAIK